MAAFGDYVYVYWNVGTADGLAGSVSGEEYTPRLAQIIAAGYGTLTTRPADLINDKPPVNPNSGVSEVRVQQLFSDLRTTLDASYAPLSAQAAAPDLMAVGTITRSANGAATSFAVVWPGDGATGTFTGTESTTAPGAIDSYTVTHVLGGVTTTYSQPALTRDANGAVTARPAIVVS